MIIKQKKSLFKPLAITTAVIIVIVAAGISVFMVTRKNNDSVARQSPIATVDSNKTNGESESVSGSVDTSQGQKVITPTAPSSTTSTLEKPAITRAEMSGDNVRISAIFSQPAYGSCTVSAQKQGEPSVTQSVSIIVGPSYYTCNGFLIPRAKFASSGVWTVTVSHEQDGNTAATSDSSSVTVE